MLRKPGAFSLNYMSNPQPNKPSRVFRNHHYRNKQNKQNNNTNNNTLTDEHYINNNTINQDTKSFEKRNNSKGVYKTQTKLKLQWEKIQKQLQQQISKLKKQNNKLRQDAKRANKSNQQNICSYQNYIKQVEGERDFIERQCVKYKQQLKYCILWIVQAFSMGQNPAKVQQFVQHKLSKTKMAQVFQKLASTIQELELEKHLKQLAVSEVKRQQYLIFSKAELSDHSNSPHPLSSLEDFNNMLDTFDLRKQTSTKSTDQQAQNIARRLFVNDDTFGHQIGDHSISHDNIKLQQFEYSDHAFIGSAAVSTNQIQSGTTVKIKSECKNTSQDYLQVKKGDQVKLLRKVGDLWIAESGTKIGYISEKIFT